MKLLMILSLLLFCISVRSQTIHKSSIDSLIKLTKSKKEKKLLARSFDSTIRENIIGAWQTTNITLLFRGNNSVRIDYKDSAAFERKWHVKDGAIIVEEKQEPESEINFKVKSYYYVLSSSPYKMEWYFPKYKTISVATKISN